MTQPEFDPFAFFQGKEIQPTTQVESSDYQRLSNAIDEFDPVSYEITKNAYYQFKDKIDNANISIGERIALNNQLDYLRSLLERENPNWDMCPEIL